jgi:uncharacterized repeat protein (TIGR03803 family)
MQFLHNKSFYAAAFAAIVFAAAISASSAVQAQTLTVLHTFTNGVDGNGPYGGLTLDQAGDLEGTAEYGGTSDAGTVFKLVKRGSSWTFNPLYEFGGGLNDGNAPQARVIVGPDGSPYGTTHGGGIGSCTDPAGCGTVFKLTPPATFCRSVLCMWNSTLLYRFTGGADGAQPGPADLLFDSQGNIYGTTEYGGASGLGVVYKLTRSNGNWMQSVLHSFTGTGSDGAVPWGGVIMDSAGNLYGTTVGGGHSGNGVVFELSPSGSGYGETTLHSFNAAQDGGGPLAGLTFDRSGNLYGTASYGGANNGGTAFELSPSGNGWTLQVLYSFVGADGNGGPGGGLTIDQSGSLYGTTQGWIDGNLPGTLYKLTPSNGGWGYTLLQSFAGNGGSEPLGAVVLDASGNVYGTTFLSSVVWQLTP